MILGWHPPNANYGGSVVPLTKKGQMALASLLAVGSAGHCPGPSVPGTGGQCSQLRVGMGAWKAQPAAVSRLSQALTPSFLLGRVSLQGPLPAWGPRVLTVGLASAQPWLRRVGLLAFQGHPPLFWWRGLVGARFLPAALGTFRILRGHLHRNPVSWSSISLSRLQRLTLQLLPHLFSPPFRLRSGQLFPDLSVANSAPPPCYHILLSHHPL